MQYEHVEYKETAAFYLILNVIQHETARPVSTFADALSLVHGAFCQSAGLKTQPMGFWEPVFPSVSQNNSATSTAKGKKNDGWVQEKMFDHSSESNVNAV